jgi:hypothetical protein
MRTDLITDALSAAGHSRGSLAGAICGPTWSRTQVGRVGDRPLTERWPVLGRHDRAAQWLQVWSPTSSTNST